MPPLEPAPNPLSVTRSVLSRLVLRLAWLVAYGLLMRAWEPSWWGGSVLLVGGFLLLAIPQSALEGRLGLAGVLGAARGLLVEGLALMVVASLIAWGVFRLGPWVTFALAAAVIGIPPMRALMVVGLRRHRTVQPIHADPRLRPLQDFAARQGQVGVWLFAAEANQLPGGVPACSGRHKGRPTIYLSRELIDSLPPPQLLAIFAHELAHRIHHDTLLSIVGWTVRYMVVAALLCAMAWLLLPGRVPLEILPALVLVDWLLHLFSRVFANALGRVQEFRANATALKMTGDVAAFEAAMRAVHAGRDDGTPARLLPRLLVSTHPSLAEVVEQARRFAASRPQPQESLT